MPRLLIWNKASKTGLRQAGDVISAVPDKHQFSESEDINVWVANGKPRRAWDGHTEVVEMPDTSLRKCRQLMQCKKRQALFTEREFQAPDPEDRFVVVEERKWRIKREDLTEQRIAKKHLDLLVENREGAKMFLAIGELTRG